ncbi:PREDICTED: early nodulin-like protein 1 [Tarenaya hassleriana]|uniref:early nodulin-like protein 1 n=1 Tax=Tarenaya hassleriana TaxID=28532 RepID=UPI00053C8726|nr:PREDICTED: early nodulin-like protein 1 [Tarenaya hassleriana]
MNPKTFLWAVTVAVISSCQNLCVSSSEYKLNWVVPPANSSDTFNDWASKKRFQVGDILQFKYNKDSVMEVKMEDYRNCDSSRPRRFSNTGKTRFRLDHSRAFYFISGMSGHCEKGQKLIVKVISPDPPTSSAPAALSVLSLPFFFLLFLLSLSSSSLLV